VRFRIAWAAAFLVVALTGCAGRVSAPPSGPGAMSSAAAVERFLQLAGKKDYVQMGWVFGNDAGPVIEKWPLPEVERRMYGIGEALQHDAYVVGNGSPLPGRIGSAESFRVRITRGSMAYQVPFIAVRGPGGHWFVEQVAIEAITNTP
jgi:hypothetical protein